MLQTALLHFRIGEFDDGTPYVTIENNGGDDLPLFRQNLVRFDLPHGTTFGEAEQIVAYLQAHVVSLSLTRSPN